MTTLQAPAVATVTTTTPNVYYTVACAPGETMRMDWQSPGNVTGTRRVHNETLDVGPFIEGTVIAFSARVGSPTYAPLVEGNGNPVSITGTPAKVGDIVTAAPGGGWAITSGQYDRAGVTIAGETALAHTLILADSHKTLGFTASGVPFRATKDIPILAYLGNVGTNLTIPNSGITASARGGNELIPQIAPEDLYFAPSPIFPNWYVAPVTFIETALPGTLTVRASIYYQGSVTQVTWAGATSNVAASGANTAVSDLNIPLAVKIPKGAVYWIVKQYLQSSGVSLSVDGSLDAANGAALAYSSGAVADLTMNPSAIVNTGGNTSTSGIVAVLYNTTNPSVAIYGNSKTKGTADTWDGANSRGIGPRSFTANRIGNGNYGIPGDGTNVFTTGNMAKRLGLAIWHSDAVIADDVNSFTAPTSLTAVQVKANQQILIDGLAAVNPGIRVWVTTTTPNSSSGNGFIDQAGQTVDPSNGQRVAFNVDRRAGLPAGVAGLFDPCTANESSLAGGGSGKWVAPPAVTADGKHALLAGNLLVVAGNVFPAASFAR